MEARGQTVLYEEVRSMLLEEGDDVACPEAWDTSVTIRDTSSDDTTRGCTSDKLEQLAHVDLLARITCGRISIFLSHCGLNLPFACGVGVCISLHLFDDERWDHAFHASSIDRENVVTRRCSGLGLINTGIFKIFNLLFPSSSIRPSDRHE